MNTLTVQDLCDTFIYITNYATHLLPKYFDIITLYKKNKITENKFYELYIKLNDSLLSSRINNTKTPAYINHPYYKQFIQLIKSQ